MKISEAEAGRIETLVSDTIQKAHEKFLDDLNRGVLNPNGETTRRDEYIFKAFKKLIIEQIENEIPWWPSDDIIIAAGKKHGFFATKTLIKFTDWLRVQVGL